MALKIPDRYVNLTVQGVATCFTHQRWATPHFPPRRVTKLMLGGPRFQGVGVFHHVLVSLPYVKTPNGLVTFKDRGLLLTKRATDHVQHVEMPQCLAACELEDGRLALLFADSHVRIMDAREGCDR